MVRNAVVVLTSLLMASGAAAQDFYASPLPAFPTSSPSVVLQRGDMRCWKVSVSSARHYTFSLSKTASSCSPVEGVIGLYAPGTLDPSMWVALADTADVNKCVTLQRRLTGGDHTLCVGGPGGEPATFFVRSSSAAAGGTPANDRCHSATLLAADSGTVGTTSLLGANHDYSPQPLQQCEVATGSKGPDRVWAIDLAPGRSLSVVLTFTSGNPTLYLLSDCGRWWNACVAASANTSGTIRRINHTNTGMQTTRYYIVVDTKVQESADFSFTWGRR